MDAQQTFYTVTQTASSIQTFLYSALHPLTFGDEPLPNFLITLLFLELFHSVAHLKVLFGITIPGLPRLSASDLWRREYYFWMDMVTVLTSWCVLSGHILGTWSLHSSSTHTAFYLTTILVLGHFSLHAWYISGWNSGNMKNTPPSKSQIRSRRRSRHDENKVYSPGSDHVHEVLVWSGSTWKAKTKTPHHIFHTCGTLYDVAVHLAMATWEWWVLERLMAI